MMYKNLSNINNKAHKRTVFENMCYALKLHCDVEQITDMQEINVVSASKDVLAVTRELEGKPIIVQKQILLLKKILTHQPIKTVEFKKLAKVKKILIKTGFKEILTGTDSMGHQENLSYAR